MKHHIVFKSLALILAACSLVTAAACALGIYACTQMQLYNGGSESFLEQVRTERAQILAEKLAYSYAARNVSDMPEEIQNNYGYTTDMGTLSMQNDMAFGEWGYAVFTMDGTSLEESPNYKTLKADHTYNNIVNTKVLLYASEYDGSSLLHKADTGEKLYFQWNAGPAYQVELLLTDNAFPASNGIPMEYVHLADTWKYGIIFLLIGALALFGSCIVYLCCTAGKKPKSDVLQPGGLNRLPLDIYAGAVVGICFAALFVFVEILANSLLTESNYLNAGIVSVTALVAFIAVLSVLGWFFALVSQIKMPNFYWWHHSLVGFCITFLWKSLVRVCRFTIRGVLRLYRLLPMVWQRVLIVFALSFAIFLVFLLFINGVTLFGVFLLLCAIFWTATLLVYDTYAFGTVMKGAKNMAQGDLSTKIPTRYLIGSYKDHAEQLNTMADVATIAAKQQMKSERMKAELITNVSHDIKTPLTSIINYVDLLQKPHSPGEEEQYLEVLQRQSQRMKKLLEDLMDMSKASTGNMTVDIGKVNAAEALNQALGEFSDKLTLAHLTPVFRTPENPVYIQADGRLTWRVLSNLLGNVAKYALPNTRVYLDLSQDGNYVNLSVKNISREELNVTADELAERFVRGDASRNTEGSGLGLNIAKSLMELQKGCLELLVDGDLFKVTLRFPAG